MPKVFTSQRQKIGELGEEIATVFLMKQGFEILERNYTQKWGEIDIVAMKTKKLYFVEVKAVSCAMAYVTRVTTYRPEENMHPKKLEKLYRTIETYLMDKKVPEKVEWQLDLLCVYIDQINKKSKVKVIENIVG
jgi:putative endonuclease